MEDEAYACSSPLAGGGSSSELYAGNSSKHGLKGFGPEELPAANSHRVVSKLANRLLFGWLPRPLIERHAKGVPEPPGIKPPLLVLVQRRGEDKTELRPDVLRFPVKYHRNTSFVPSTLRSWGHVSSTPLDKALMMVGLGIGSSCQCAPVISTHDSSLMQRACFWAPMQSPQLSRCFLPTDR